jgi:hypothetical protein
MPRYARIIGLLRYLRVAWSLVWGVLFLLVIFFWVRSYWWNDSGYLKLLPTEYVAVHAGDGRMCAWFEHKPIKGWFEWLSNPIMVHTPPDAENRCPPFDLAFWPTFARLYLAHWVLAVVTGLLAVVPWCPRRFSMRGFLIATTVIAAIAGVIAWVDQTF